MFTVPKEDVSEGMNDVVIERFGDDGVITYSLGLSI